MKFDGKHELWDPTSELGSRSTASTDVEAEEQDLNEVIDENSSNATK